MSKIIQRVAKDLLALEKAGVVPAGTRNVTIRKRVRSGRKPAKSARLSRGPYGRHEARHMTWFLLSAVEQELCEHPAIKGHKRRETLAALAFHALCDLYREIP